MKDCNTPSNLFELMDILKEQKIPSSDYKRHVDWFLENKLRQQGIPMHGSFELTPLCNLDCKMCYIHLSNQEFDSSRLLPVKTWLYLIEQSYKAGMRKATLTGGECLTYPGFDELYLFLYNHGIKSSILTNGLLLDKKRLDFFNNFPPSLFQITLYGSSDDAYEKVTGHRVFNIIYNNLLRLRESRHRVMLILTPSIFMKEDIRSLLDMAMSLGIPFNINSRLIVPRKNTGRDLYDLSLEQYIEIYRIKKELNQEVIVPIDPAELPDENHIGEKKYGFQCGGGRSSFVIKYDGTISPCPSMYDLSVNALDIGFDNAWKQLNSIVNHYPMPAECNGCKYHDYCMLCPAIHKNAGRLGHCDPQVCVRTKRLLQEGFIKFQR